MTQFWMGRDKQYAAELTQQIISNAQETVKRANALLAIFHEQNPESAIRGVNSGWRPPEVNSNVKGAALKSKHMTGEAVDISDADNSLDAWLMTDSGQKALTDIGLWLEHPSSTPHWAHVQTVPPGSGHRVFYP